MQAETILRFWFEEAGPEKWFAKDADFDAEITARFMGTYEAAAAGELFEWRSDDAGRLAEIIVLDQFARNLFRDKSRAFEADPVALVLAQEAVGLGAHHRLGDRRATLLMPYMHSESRRIHEIAVELFAGTVSFDYEVQHKKIIDRFGRYPHRNALLGRVSTEEERAFLATPGSSF
jgi:uncharacterized protein (DUF924 family)